MITECRLCNKLKTYNYQSPRVLGIIITFYKYSMHNTNINTFVLNIKTYIIMTLYEYSMLKDNINKFVLNINTLTSGNFQ
jgi:hypothetical protein